MFKQKKMRTEETKFVLMLLAYMVTTQVQL